MLFQPLPHQLSAIEEMKQKMNDGITKGLILSHEMGLGKTITMSLYLKETKRAEPDLIICPTSVISTWYQEIMVCKDYLEESDPVVRVYHGKDRSVEGEYDYMVTSYGVATTDTSILMNRRWGRIVLDESHYIKNKSKRSKSLIELKDSAEERFCVTGTPFNNKTEDLGLQASFIGTEPYNDMNWWQNNKDNPVEVKKWFDYNVLVKSKKELKLETYEPVYNDITITHSEVEDKEIQRIKDETKEKFLEWNKTSGMKKNELGIVIISLISKLRIMSSCFYGLQDGYKSKDVLTNCSKIRQLMNDVKARIKVDPLGGVVVFSEFSNKVLKVIRRVFSNCKSFKNVSLMSFTGQLSIQEKDKVINEFNTSTKPRILFASLLAGGTGISLHKGSSSVFILEPYWHPFVEKQAEQRVNRIGQMNQVHVYRYICDNSIEQWIAALKERKYETFINISSLGSQSHTFSIKDLSSLFNTHVIETSKETKNKKV